MPPTETDPSSNGDSIVHFIVEDKIHRSVSPSEMDRYHPESRNVSFECSSGDVIRGRWRGISLEHVLDDLPLPGDTTHLLAEAADGHRVCLDIREAFDALLAFERLNGEESTDAGLPRLLVSGISGPRTLKWVQSIRPIRLASDEDPSDYEPIPPTMAAESSNG